MSTVEHKDFAGNKINVGDLVIYAALHGRSAALHYGLVLRLKSKKVNNYNKDTRENEQIDWPTIGVRGVQMDWFQKKHELLKSGSEITLGDLDRVTVVSMEQVHPEALKIFEETSKQDVKKILGQVGKAWRGLQSDD